MNLETRIRLDYLEIKSQINFLSRLCNITEIFSLNKLFRCSKLIILDRTKTNIILVSYFFIRFHYKLLY
jgi:hypothetical protein